MPIDALYTTTLDVQEPTGEGTDARGNPTKTWATKGGQSAVPCRLRRLAVQAQPRNDKGEVTITAKIWAPPTLDIDQTTDRVVVDGVAWRVVQIIPALARATVDHYQLQVIDRPEDN